jgi:hypothetical protein
LPVAAQNGADAKIAALGFDRTAGRQPTSGLAIKIAEGFDLQMPGQKVTQKLGRPELRRNPDPLLPDRSEGGKIEPREGLDPDVRDGFRGRPTPHEATPIR